MKTLSAARALAVPRHSQGYCASMGHSTLFLASIHLLTRLTLSINADRPQCVTLLGSPAVRSRTMLRLLNPIEIP